MRINFGAQGSFQLADNAKTHARTSHWIAVARKSKVSGSGLDTAEAMQGIVEYEQGGGRSAGARFGLPQQVDW